MRTRAHWGPSSKRRLLAWRGPHHVPRWSSKWNFKVHPDVSTLTDVSSGIMGTHTCVRACRWVWGVSTRKPASRGGCGCAWSMHVGGCESVPWDPRSQAGKPLWVLPCQVLCWQLHAWDLVCSPHDHPVEKAVSPHFAGEDMAAELSHLSKVTQVRNGDFEPSLRDCTPGATGACLSSRGHRGMQA